MAAVPGLTYSPPYVPYGASGPGLRVGQTQAVGRDTPADPTSYEPQFAEPFIQTRQVNNQTMQLPYDRPEQRVTRAPRMPKAFGLGIERILSVSAWPFLPIVDPLRHQWVGMTGARVPRYSAVGWGEPKRNIIMQPNTPYGSIVEMEPSIYGELAKIYQGV